MLLVLGGVTGGIVDFRLKAEENKQKYLDMLTTKLFLNEEEVVGLSSGASKAVIVICPLCSKQKVRRFADISKTGHTLCSGCSKSIKTGALFLGTRKGKLFIYDFAFPHQGKKQWYQRLKAVCDCGTDKEYFTSELKSTGETFSCGCWGRELSRARVGELNPNYDDTISEEERRKRRNNYTKKWASAVKQRDDYTCQVCGSTEKLVAHHLNSYKNNPDARYDIDNGVTVCRDCHTEFHVGFMGNFSTPCTRENFNEYLLQV